MAPIKIYLASAAENRALIHVVADRIQDSWGEHGLPHYEIVGNWWNTPPVENVIDRCAEDFTCGIDQADIVLAIYPYGPGTTSEMGYAIGKGKPVIYYHYAPCDEDDQPLIAGLLGLDHIKGAVAPSWGAAWAMLRRFREQGHVPKRIDWK